MAHENKPLTYQQFNKAIRADDPRLRDRAWRRLAEWMAGEPSLILSPDEALALGEAAAAGLSNLRQGNDSDADAADDIILALRCSFARESVNPKLDRILSGIVGRFQMAASPPWPTLDLCKELAFVMAEAVDLGFVDKPYRRGAHPSQWMSATKALRKAIANEIAEMHESMKGIGELQDNRRGLCLARIATTTIAERLGAIKRVLADLDELESLLGLDPQRRGRPQDLGGVVAAKLGSVVETIWAKTGRPIGSQDNKIATRNVVTALMADLEMRYTRHAVKAAITRRANDAGKSDQNLS